MLEFNFTFSRDELNNLMNMVISCKLPEIDTTEYNINYHSILELFQCEFIINEFMLENTKYSPICSNIVQIEEELYNIKLMHFENNTVSFSPFELMKNKFINYFKALNEREKQDGKKCNSFKININIKLLDIEYYTIFYSYGSTNINFNNLKPLKYEFSYINKYDNSINDYYYSDEEIEELNNEFNKLFIENNKINVFNVCYDRDRVIDGCANLKYSN